MKVNLIFSLNFIGLNIIIMKKHVLNFSFLLAIVFLGGSCAISQGVDKEEENKLIVEEKESVIKSEIVIMHFDILKKDGQTAISLGHYNKVLGKLKHHKPSPKSNQHLLVLEVLDADEEVLKTIKIDHPLYPFFEIASDDTYQLTVESMEKEEDKFMLRLQNQMEIDALRFTEYIEDKKIVLPVIKVDFKK